jgi:hypothetical protein
LRPSDIDALILDMRERGKVVGDGEKGLRHPSDCTQRCRARPADRKEPGRRRGPSRRAQNGSQVPPTARGPGTTRSSH